jgi:hypothetical protein
MATVRAHAGYEYRLGLGRYLLPYPNEPWLGPVLPVASCFKSQFEYGTEPYIIGDIGCTARMQLTQHKLYAHSSRHYDAALVQPVEERRREAEPGAAG